MTVKTQGAIWRFEIRYSFSIRRGKDKIFERWYPRYSFSSSGNHSGQWELKRLRSVRDLISSEAAVQATLFSLSASVSHTQFPFLSRSSGFYFLCASLGYSRILYKSQQSGYMSTTSRFSTPDLWRVVPHPEVSFWRSGVFAWYWRKSTLSIVLVPVWLKLILSRFARLCAFIFNELKKAWRWSLL